MRHTKGHTGNRRSHHALAEVALIASEKGSLRLPHRIDEAKGTYRGRQIAPARGERVAKQQAKALATTPAPAEPAHEHAHVAHENAEAKAAVATGRSNSRSGTGGS